MSSSRYQASLTLDILFLHDYIFKFAMEFFSFQFAIFNVQLFRKENIKVLSTSMAIKHAKFKLL